MSRQKSCLGRIARQNNAFPHNFFSKCRSHTLASKAAIGFFVSPATLFEFRCWRIRFSFPPASASAAVFAIQFFWPGCCAVETTQDQRGAVTTTHTHTCASLPPFFIWHFWDTPPSSFYAAPPTPPLASARIKNPLSPPPLLPPSPEPIKLFWKKGRGISSSPLRLP